LGVVDKSTLVTEAPSGACSRLRRPFRAESAGRADASGLQTHTHAVVGATRAVEPSQTQTCGGLETHRVAVHPRRAVRATISVAQTRAVAKRATRAVLKVHRGFHAVGTDGAINGCAHVARRAVVSRRARHAKGNGFRIELRLVRALRTLLLLRRSASSRAVVALVTVSCDHRASRVAVVPSRTRQALGLVDGAPVRLVRPSETGNLRGRGSRAVEARAARVRVVIRDAIEVCRAMHTLGTLIEVLLGLRRRRRVAKVPCRASRANHGRLARRTVVSGPTLGRDDHFRDRTRVARVAVDACRRLLAEDIVV
jgi:hypothetical protein